MDLRSNLLLLRTRVVGARNHVHAHHDAHVASCMLKASCWCPPLIILKPSLVHIRGSTSDYSTLPLSTPTGEGRPKGLLGAPPMSPVLVGPRS
jgi:hypothetical protein